MSDKQPAFVVTDRRKFTLDGELREPSETAEELRESAATATPAAVPSTSAQPADTAAASLDNTATELDELPGDEEAEDDLGPAPTAKETADQHAAYQKSSDQIDDMLKQANPGAPPPLDVNFEQIVQSFYLSAMVAMGAGAEPGQKARVDIVGARQSIDMLSVLSEKTKGNLTDREEKLLQTALFNLRMMFLEITNAITAKATQPPARAPHPKR